MLIKSARQSLALPRRKQFRELFRIRYRRFAREIFADVGGWFSVDDRHRPDRFVVFAKILLAFSSVGHEQNFIRQKMSLYLREQRFRRGIIELSCNHDLARLA